MQHIDHSIGDWDNVNKWQGSIENFVWGQSVDRKAEKERNSEKSTSPLTFSFLEYAPFACKSISSVLLLILEVNIISSCGDAYRCNIPALSVPHNNYNLSDLSHFRQFISLRIGRVATGESLPVHSNDATNSHKSIVLTL